jgi:2,4-dienoyl-CoA reductase-like NADH-dependent reductase (Old Yellow Enzyme family)
MPLYSPLAQLDNIEKFQAYLEQFGVTAVLKQACPGLTVVGSAYSYLQQWLPNVAQAVVRQGKADIVGLGRMMLVYPQFPADVLAGKSLQVEKMWQRFSAVS